VTLTDRVGYAKFCFNVGKEYGDLFRGSVTGGAALTFVANWLGLSPLASVGVGVALVPVAIAISVGAGYLVVRWRIVHATIEQTWEHNPFMRAEIDLLREIRDGVTRNGVEHAGLKVWR
jgi:hypothetical protein